MLYTVLAHWHESFAKYCIYGALRCLHRTRNIDDDDDDDDNDNDAESAGHTMRYYNIIVKYT